MNPAPAAIDVRPMTGADVERVMEIAASLPNAPHWPRLAWIDVLSSCASGRRIALVAAAGRASDAPQGFIVALLFAPQAELEVVAVAADWQRMGLGRRLLAAMVEQLKRAEIREFLLEVRSSNLAAMELYGGAGFKQSGIRAGYYSDPVEDAILMSLQVL